MAVETERLPRERVAIGALAWLALAAIGLSALGVQPPRFGPPPTPPAVPGVEARSVVVLARSTSTSPPGDWAYFTIAADGTFLVTDRQRRSVLHLSATGQLLAEWGPVFGTVTLNEPAGIAQQAGVIYVADRSPARLFRLSPDGRFQGAISLEPLGTYGLNSLLVGPDGSLYLADTGRNRILVLAPDGSLQRQFGKPGKALGDFTQPYALAFGADGSIFVADWENSRIERWDASQTATNFWTLGFRPFGVAVDPLGRVYAPDAERKRILAYTSAGEPLGEIGATTPRIDLNSPNQLMYGGVPPALFVLGRDGLARVDLGETAPPPQPTASNAPVGLPLLFLAIGVGLLVLGFWLRLRRRRTAAPVEARTSQVEPADQPPTA